VASAGGDSMNEFPQWLPEMVCVDGNFNDIVSRLYNIFHRDFVENNPKLTDIEVWHDRRVMPGETYEVVFWHLIERDRDK